MPFLLLMILMAASMPVQWPEPYFDLDPIQCVAATGACILGFLLICWIVSRRTVRQLIASKSDPERTDRIGNRYGRIRTLLFVGSLGLFAFVLFVLGWGWAVSDLLTIRIQDGKWIDLPTLSDYLDRSPDGVDWRWLPLPGLELVTLLPFLMIMVGSWFIFYDVERTFHQLGVSQQEDVFWSRGGYVLYRARHFFVLVFVPVFLLMFQQGLLRLYPQLSNSPWMRITSLLMIPMLLVILPVMLPTLLGWRRLPEGSTRNRLIAHARRLGFRYREIFLWDTRKGVANAMVVGVVPQARYVVFTDRLLEDLREDEVDAVFGHEVGHARHAHLIYYATFLLLSVLTVGAIYEALRQSRWFDGQDDQNWIILAPVLFMGLYLFLVFGFLSRRCERQADLFGCRAGSCGDPNCDGHHGKTALVPRGNGLCRTGIDAFIRALRRVEEINGMTQAETNRRTGLFRAIFQWFGVLIVWLQTWQHSTISKRIAFLRRVQNDHELEQQFQRWVFLLRLFFLMLLLGTLVSLAFVWGPDVIVGAI